MEDAASLSYGSAMDLDCRTVWYILGERTSACCRSVCRYCERWHRFIPIHCGFRDWLRLTARTDYALDVYCWRFIWHSWAYQLQLPKIPKLLPETFLRWRRDARPQLSAIPSQIFMPLPPPGHTGKRRRYVLDLSVRPYVCPFDCYQIVSMIF